MSISSPETPNRFYVYVLPWMLFYAGCLPIAGRNSVTPQALQSSVVREPKAKQPPSPTQDVADATALSPSAFSRQVCTQSSNGEPFSTAEQLRSRPPRRVSPSVQSKTIVLNHFEFGLF